ncbi:MAG: coenzyme A pyrophosphatase [Bacteroidetes bacterium]|nr:MAG: coenzyme A pyrophosphatase [Bacteroidota bacterium]
MQQPLPGERAHEEMAPDFRERMLKEGLHTAPPIPSAVLILLYKKEGEWHIPFIRRVVDNRAHSGQVSLPGGRKEQRDYDLKATAMRETREEIGIPHEKIKVMGTLTPLYIPISNFLVTPYVGFHTGENLSFIPSPKEVSYIIEAPVTMLMDTTNKITYPVEKETIAPAFRIHNEVIWGATSMIINELIHLTRHKTV